MRPAWRRLRICAYSRLEKNIFISKNSLSLSFRGSYVFPGVMIMALEYKNVCEMMP